MYSPIHFKSRTLTHNSLIRSSPLRRGFFLLALVLASFALAPTTRAVTPAPDGGYPNHNTAEGDNALFSLDTRFGTDNTAIGFDALANNTNGSFNTANGAFALVSNETGSFNTANGSNALFYNRTGDNNTANGVSALFFNTTGNNNTANGVSALSSNTTGIANTANGVSALLSNETGGFNTANGVQALNSNTTGGGNTANGNFALFSNTTGSSNTADGFDALFNNTTGSSNIAVGLGAGGNLTTGKNNIDIGNSGVAGESNKIRIGTVGTQMATFIAGISGVTVPNGVGVIVGANGKLGTVVSSERFKDEIKPMDKASEAILALKPVTFHYKHELDPEGIPQFGLVAEQVEKVSPDLVARDEEGKPYTVRYEAINAMLLNEFLKEHRKVEEQEATITQLKAADTKHEAAIAQQQKEFQATVAEQQKEIAALTASLREQASQIQRVTRLRRAEVSKPASEMVVNNQ